ncbi:tetratricopeptide repeat protein [Flavobacterium sp. ALJ2]|uniref:transcriptional regulator n=1 Tax=Flavobacterium sp. ALJ2 TaxID=2786960 RepID=UPI0018A10F96|nr:tetratricopeptide repeat protein [Flavobacterium sp. ALJ2]MBF7093303.1 tetratricopeptide repeat protein [Flavobacterium sp. ALJ2]
MKRILLFILLCTYNIVISQNNVSKIDSLLHHAINIENESPLKSQLEAIKVISLAKEFDYTNGVLLAEIFLSESYTRSKDNKLALYYATQADKRITSSEPYLKSKTLRLRGVTLARLGFYNDASKILKESIVYANKIKDKNDRNRSLGFIYSNIALNHEENEIDEDSVGYYYRKCYLFFENIDEDNPHKNRCMAFANVFLGSFYLKKQDLEKADAYLKRAAKLSKELKLDFITIEAISGLGSVNFYRENYDDAKKYFQEALLLAKKNGRVFYTNDLYYNLSKTYNVLKIQDSTKYYRYKYITLNDSLSKLYKEAIYTSLRIFLEEKDEKMMTNVEIIIALLSLLLIIITITFVYIKKYKVRFVNVKKEGNDIDNQLKGKIELIEKLTNQKKNVEVKGTDLKRLVVEGSPLFFAKFKEMHPDYIEKIINITPTIVSSELRFCALLKLGFSTQEIAVYTKSTIRAVQSKRYRLRKKLDVPPEVDLYDWLTNI